MNGVLIYEVTQFLAPVLSETTHAIQLDKPFDATHAIIIPLKLNLVTSYFEVRKHTQEEYEDQNNHNIEFTKRDNYLSTLSNHMLLMLKMLQMTRTMPLCWKVLSIHHLLSSTSHYSKVSGA